MADILLLIWLMWLGILGYKYIASKIKVVNILDDGNGISIHMEKGKLKAMDYSQQRELQILLGFIQKISSVDHPVEILLWEDPIVL